MFSQVSVLETNVTSCAIFDGTPETYQRLSRILQLEQHVCVKNPFSYPLCTIHFLHVRVQTFDSGFLDAFNFNLSTTSLRIRSLAFPAYLISKSRRLMKKLAA